MLIAQPAKNKGLINFTTNESYLHLTTDRGQIKLQPYSDTIVRITYTLDSLNSNEKSLGVVANPTIVSWNLDETDTHLILKTNAITIDISKESCSFTYKDRLGNLLLKEPDFDGKSLDPFASYKTILDEHTQVEKSSTADGIKETIVNAEKVFDKQLYHGRLDFEWQDDEALYGMGQQEEGILNLRGHRQYIFQANKKIAMPFLLSSKNYGLLIDTYSPLTFSDNAYGSYIYTEAIDALDFYFIQGNTFDEIIGGYRTLTGQATMLPKWAFGYMQSFERYEDKDELIGTIKEYRERNIPIDSIVLDWQSWEAEQWGQKTFDQSRFGNPKGMIDELHALGVFFMISIWPNMNEGTDNNNEFKAKGGLLKRSDIYDAFDENARALYWQQTKEGLFDYGVDAWWTDATEPFTPAWLSEMPTEPHATVIRFHDIARTYLDETLTNAYPLVHAQTLYEGQREVTSDKRVINLTRSGYTGQQRYGNILWSGDITAKWSTLKKQIAAGLNLCASGLPYWTLDIGGFFVKRSTAWYWNGDYDLGNEDPEYRHLYTRWFQFASFLPVLRAHGTDTRREVWQFGEPGTPYYDTIVDFIDLRYKLLPYIYSLAGMVTQKDYTLLRLLAFDYPGDKKVYDIADQFMFGNAFMVCPITDPSNQRSVYLPHGNDWTNYFTGEKYHGGQTINLTCPINELPIYVPSGAIIPMTTSPIQSTKEFDDSHIAIDLYTGKDGQFTLYQDYGDNYDYENGAFSMIDIAWDDANRSLFFSERHNNFDSMPETMVIDLYLDKCFQTTITYKHSSITVQL